MRLESVEFFQEGVDCQLAVHFVVSGADVDRLVGGFLFSNN